MRTVSIFLLSIMMFTNSASAATGIVPHWDKKYLSGQQKVILHTSMGDIAITLDATKAPKTVTNFVTLAKNGYYDHLTFHRVIPGFMIQGGDPNGNGTGGKSIYGKTFEDERNDIPTNRGTIAMANAGPNTNGSQFFIVQTDSPFLKNGSAVYTTFGTVTSGLDVIDAIAHVPRDSNDKPKKSVIFTIKVAGATVVKKRAATKKK